MKHKQLILLMCLLMSCVIVKADVTIWVKKSADPTYVYAWDKQGTNLLGEWPGKQLTIAEDVAGWYMCLVKDVDQCNIILNNGNSGEHNQTGDIIGVTGTHYYQYPDDPNDQGTYLDLGTDIANITNPPTGVVINNENFPDPEMRRFLLNAAVQTEAIGFTFVGFNQCFFVGEPSELSLNVNLKTYASDYLLKQSEIRNICAKFASEVTRS